MERVEVVGPDLVLMLDRSPGCASSSLGYDCCCVDRQFLDVVLPCKNKEEGGRRGLRPWPLRCLSQFLSERKERLLEGECVANVCVYLSPLGEAMYL